MKPLIQEETSLYQDQINKLIKNKNFKNNFIDSLNDIALFLKDVKKFLDSENFKITNSQINKKFILNNFLPLIDHLSLLVNNLSQFCCNISKDKFLSYKKITQEKLGKYFMLAPFPNRAFNKPLGFAGDYKMMYMIQELQDEGDSLFSKFINVYYTNIPISNSVKNRTSKISSYIDESINNAMNNDLKNVEILSEGCGPALGVKKYLSNNDPEVNCTFNLLDFNKETLDFIKNKTLSSVKNKKFNINLIEKSVFDLTSHNAFQKVVNKKFDFIYCCGLFDYLSNKLCQKLVNIFYNSLKKNGKLLVTNMHVNNNDKYLMELLLDWHLIYRNEDDMINIANNLGLYKTFTDSTGINLCLEIKKI